MEVVAQKKKNKILIKDVLQFYFKKNAFVFGLIRIGMMKLDHLFDVD